VKPLPFREMRARFAETLGSVAAMPTADGRSSELAELQAATTALGTELAELSADFCSFSADSASLRAASAPALTGIPATGTGLGAAL
jgi:hypothetical protein